MNPLKQLHSRGQSFWFDYIRRTLIASGELKRLIDEDGLRGMTSNPAIFEQAIGGTDEYDEMMRELIVQNPYLSSMELYEELAIQEIQNACDVLRTVYDASGGSDGFVSLEVSPHLARETAATIDEGRRLWEAVDRPNLMIKVPATPEGNPAITALIADGINVNVTLMFSLDHYEAVADAYIQGLEQAHRKGIDLSNIHSVASFFVSRVDSKLDAKLDAIGTDEALALKGKIAIANSKVTYVRFKEIFLGEPFAHLREQGANAQRVLWASTSTKDPSYPDTLYVDTLIGPHTVNTMPPQTVDAFRDRGTVSTDTVEEDLDEAEHQLQQLADLGIDLDVATEELQNEGVDKFSVPFDKLLDAIEKKRKKLRTEVINQADYQLNGLQSPVDQRLQAWDDADFGNRMWCLDTTLWSDEPVDELGNRLGWLELPQTMLATAQDIKQLAADVKDDFDHVVVLGMGGSSLAPDVFRQTFGSADGYPALLMLDSTHPDAVRDVMNQVDVERSLFIVASKSGGTAETMSFFRTFYDALKDKTDTPGQHFIAITDPGTSLEHLAHERDFRRLFSAPADVGGRYSALTVFGLVPAGLIGVDIELLLDRAVLVAKESAFKAGASKHPGLRLGAALGEAANAGRDKVTFVTSSSLDAFPIWLEQLIAESTGKDDVGIVPIADEALASPDMYGNDRFFVYFHVDGDDNHPQKEKLDALEAAGHPVARISLDDTYDLGREMYNWEVAVAAAGAAMGIHPFNQPNVELAKILAKEAMKNASSGGGDSVAHVSVDDDNLHQTVSDWLGSSGDGDYIALHAYIPPSDDTTEALQSLRHALRDQTHCATTLGYGPRFLHSTGQLHKGGANNGLFLQLVDGIPNDLAVPETDFTFRQLIKAQAQGDYQALEQRERRVLRVHLGDDAQQGLHRLLDAMKATA